MIAWAIAWQVGVPAAVAGDHRAGERDGRCLLARNARARMPFFSALAGFVEVGETLEQCVAREVREEAGVERADLRCFGSQAWPFTGSLMIGFTARWASGEIVEDPTEIVDAGWFRARRAADDPAPAVDRPRADRRLRPPPPPVSRPRSGDQALRTPSSMSARASSSERSRIQSRSAFHSPAISSFRSPSGSAA